MFLWFHFFEFTWCIEKSQILEMERRKFRELIAQLVWTILQTTIPVKAGPGGSYSKELPAGRETWVQSLGWEDSPGEGNGYPLQYSCWENPMDRGACWVTIDGVSRVRHGWAINTLGLGDQKVQAFLWCIKKCFSSRGHLYFPSYTIKVINYIYIKVTYEHCFTFYDYHVS